MNLKSVFFGLFLVLSNTVFCQDNIRFEQFSNKTGIALTRTECVYQDSEGFIWFGTQTGLNRFDGYKVRTFSNNLTDTSSISSNLIHCVYEDKNKNLWIGSFNQGLSLFNRKTNTFRNFRPNPKNPKSIPASEIEDIFEDKEDCLWLSSSKEGLIRFDLKKETFKSYKKDNSTIPTDYIKDVTQDKKGLLWIATDSGLCSFDKKTEKFIVYPIGKENNGVASRYTKSVLVDLSDNIWIGTDGGITFFDRKKNTFVSYTNQVNNPRSLPSNYVKSILEDQKGTIWVGSDGGISFFNPKTQNFTNYVSNADISESLINNFVKDIYQDRAGSIWIATDKGLDKFELRGNSIQLFRRNVLEKNTLINNYVNSVFEDSEELIWIGTNEGVSAFNRKTQSYENFSVKDGLTNKSVLAIGEDKDGFIWIGTDNGINRLDKKTKKIEQFFPQNSQIVHHCAMTIFVDSRGILWVGTWEGLAKYNPKTKTFKNYTPQPPDFKNGLLSAYIRTIYEDRNGILWVGTRQGLYAFDREKEHFTAYNNNPFDEKSLSNDWVMAITEDARGVLWVGTYNGGLNIFDKKNKNFRRITEKDGLASNSVRGVLGDKEGNIWVSTNKGICKYIPPILPKESGSFKYYVHGDGLQSNEFNECAFFKTQNGEFVFGGINGFNIIRPEEVVDNNYIPPVVLTDLEINGQKVGIGAESVLKKDLNEIEILELDYQQNSLLIEFSALNFINPENNRFVYQLEGYDKDWTLTNSERRGAIYTNLQPAEYIFRVKAANNHGSWNNTGKILKIIIRPPFWKTWWFQIGSTILFFTLIFAFYKWRIRQIKLQNKRLEEQVKIKTKELRQKNSELEEQKEQILLQKTEIQNQAEELESQRDSLVRQNDTIRIQNGELEKKQHEVGLLADNLTILNGEITSKNKKFVDSVRYARTIQQAILPDTRNFDESFSDYFVLFRPKDIVSGDFYWFTKIMPEEWGSIFPLVYVAVVDCTGHGVPGAFMSMIGSRLLNEIVNEKDIYEPDQILHRLDHGVRKALRQEDNYNSDGMDIALCLFEKVSEIKTKVVFSGAKSILYVYEKNADKIVCIKGDKKAIGGKKRHQKEFNNREFTLHQGDAVWLASDGLPDQNSPQRENFGTPRLIELLEKHATLPMAAQQTVLETELETHQQHEEQRDDITVIGIRI